MRQVLHGSASTTAQSFEQRYRLRITRSATSVPTSPSCATKVERALCVAVDGTSKLAFAHIRDC